MKYVLCFFLFLLLIIINPPKVDAQSVAVQNRYGLSFETTGLASTAARTPFWFQANQYGIVPTEGYFLSTRLGAQVNYQRDTTKKQIRLLDWGAGFYGVANVAKQPQLLLPEAYLKVRLGKIEAWGGRRRELYGLLGDSTLSSGSYSWSGNAFPITKLQINTLGFVEIPFTKKLIAFSATFAHGWFGDLVIPSNYDVSIAPTFLHQKSLYIRLGKPTAKLRLYGGFMHNVMWGSEDKIWDYSGLTPRVAFKEVLVGGSWQSSRVGNHLGNLDFGLEYALPAWTLLMQRQFVYEAGALGRLTNLADGLNSITLKRRGTARQNGQVSLKTLLLEILNTNSQGGDVFDFASGQFGRENYFNHYLYQQGWSFKNRIIGTPFMTSNNEIKKELSIPAGYATANNRVLLIHLGVSGVYKTNEFLAKLSYSANQGIYGIVFSPKLSQFSGLFSLSRPTPWLQGSVLRISLATDFGQLLNNSTGIMLGLQKTINPAQKHK